MDVHGEVGEDEEDNVEDEDGDARKTWRKGSTKTMRMKRARTRTKRTTNETNMRTRRTRTSN